MGQKIVAMILAGGKGTRLEALTKKVAKPAVSFGAKYRIIDFPLSNCANSHIDTVGVLVQYESVSLDEYIGNGEKWGLNGVRSLTTTLAPRQIEEGMTWYKGTADAIYANLDFLDQCDPQYVLILSGDHIYSTTYDGMLEDHISKNAECTISVYEVPIEEASRFGILVADKNGKIIEFQEKPAHPTSNLASMGIYIFNYKTLRKALIKDAQDDSSDHDFGKNIIPMLLGEGKKLIAYKYKGYWKDVGTIKSLHEANMDLINDDVDLNFDSIMGGLKIYSADAPTTPQYVGKDASISDSLINQGAVVLGKVKKSVISNEVYIEKGAKVENSVVMPGVLIKKNAVVKNAVIAPDSIVYEKDEVIGEDGQVVLYSRKVKAHE
jgi:glucose-1-phosphate adenylyltransferase